MYNHDKKIQLCCEDSIYQLSCLESIIRTTIDSCLERETSAKYYNLPPKDKFTLSQERTHYINMMTIALDKLSNIIELNTKIENNINCL